MCGRAQKVRDGGGWPTRGLLQSAWLLVLPRRVGPPGCQRRPQAGIQPSERWSFLRPPPPVTRPTRTRAAITTACICRSLRVIPSLRWYSRHNRSDGIIVEQRAIRRCETGRHGPSHLALHYVSTQGLNAVEAAHVASVRESTRQRLIHQISPPEGSRLRTEESLQVVRDRGAQRARVTSREQPVADLFDAGLQTPSGHQPPH
jgi:hypothetical protein